MNGAPPTSLTKLTLRPGDEDIGAVMALERGPGSECCVGRSSAEEHRAILAAPGSAFRVGVGPRGEALAFAILTGLADPHGNLYLERVAAARPGEGIGTAFLSLVLDEAFGPMGAWRFFLDRFVDNLRAQAAYSKLGFSRDGILREAYRQSDGRRADQVLMSLLNNEWRGRKALRGEGEMSTPPSCS